MRNLRRSTPGASVMSNMVRGSTRDREVPTAGLFLNQGPEGFSGFYWEEYPARRILALSVWALEKASAKYFIRCKREDK